MAKAPSDGGPDAVQPMMEDAPKSDAKQPDAPQQDTVKIIAKATFTEGPDFTGRLLHSGDEAEVERGRANELRAQGFCTFADKDAEEAAKKDDLPASDQGQPVTVMRGHRRPKE